MVRTGAEGDVGASCGWIVASMADEEHTYWWTSLVDCGLGRGRDWAFLSHSPVVVEGHTYWRAGLGPP